MKKKGDKKKSGFFSKFKKKDKASGKSAKTGPVPVPVVDETATKPDAAVAADENESVIGTKQTVFAKGPGQKVSKEDFDLLKVIGKGSFGKVMLVKKKDDGQIYAMKVLRKDAIIKRRQVAHTRAEKDILTKLKHPFIVNLNYAFQTPDKLFMILDFINGGELFFHLKNEGRFSESRVKLYAAEISLAMAHCHKIGVVYRDIKPENILISNLGHIVITDFGLCKQIDDGGTKTFCGTPEYLAPEVLKGQAHGLPVDWWSLGTLSYEMLTGLPPYYSQNINEMYEKILYDPLVFPAFLSADCQSFLEGLLTRDPDQRLGSDNDGDEVLAHPWLAQFDKEKLLARGYTPEFIPKPSSAISTEYIDEAFLAEGVDDSEGSGDAVGGDDFEGFTFQQESILGQ